MKQVFLAVVVIVVAVSLSVAGTLAHFSDTEVSPGNTLETAYLDLKLSDIDEYGDGISQTWSFPLAMPGDSLSASATLQNVGDDINTTVHITCVNRNSEILDDHVIENQAENALVQAGIDNDFDGDVDEDPIDGIDNDGDTLVDEDGIPVLSGVDNDSDGDVDEDPVDGIDNDLDTLVDEDPGDIPLAANRGIYDKDRWMVITAMMYDSVDCLALLSDADGDGRISLNDLEILGLYTLPAPVGGGTIGLTMTVWFDTLAENEYQGDQVDMTLIFTLQ